MEGRLIRREFALGDLAHIVGQHQTTGSPRGLADLPADERDKADNLMLICKGEHAEIDRAGSLDVMTVEKLRKLKRDHEDRIRYRFPSQCAALQGGGEGTPRRQAWC